MKLIEFCKYVVFIFIRVIFYIASLFFRKKYDVCFYTGDEKVWDGNLQILYSRIKKENNLTVIHLSKCNKWTWYHLIRSKVILFDHTIPYYTMAQGQIRINLWHGVPIKKIRYHLLDRFDASNQNQSDLTTYVSSNNDYDRLLMSTGLNVPMYKIKSIGIPRLDYLHLSEKELEFYDIYSDAVEIKSRTKSFSKVILWAPTYRGKPTSIDDKVFDPIEQKEICNYLQSNNYCMCIKMHKFSLKSEYEVFNKCDNVIFINDLINTNIILRYVDLLITDFSSIWIDYLTLNKPIIFFAKDYCEYSNEHGFILEFEKQIPTELLVDFYDLMSAIKHSEKLIVNYEEQKNKFLPMTNDFSGAWVKLIESKINHRSAVN
ncbi:CDP-glycerol glycerophosphotransferase family protein [Vibrio breoganii]